MPVNGRSIGRERILDVDNESIAPTSFNDLSRILVIDELGKRLWGTIRRDRFLSKLEVVLCNFSIRIPLVNRSTYCSLSARWRIVLVVCLDVVLRTVGRPHPTATVIGGITILPSIRIGASRKPRCRLSGNKVKPLWQGASRSQRASPQKSSDRNERVTDEAHIGTIKFD